LEDYAYVVQGLLALYQEDFNPEWYHHAVRIQEAQDQHFSGLGKRYSLSPLQRSPLPPRQDFLDSDLPSAQGTAISNLLTLNALTQEAGDGPESESGKLLRHAEQLLLAVGDTVVKSPVAHAQYLMALDQYMDSQTIVFMTPGPLEKSNATEMLMKFGSSYYPHAVLAGSDVSNKDSGIKVLKDKDLFQGAAGVYILGGEGNVEFNNLTSSGDAEGVLQNPSRVVFD